jgi:hypothetical protein
VIFTVASLMGVNPVASAAGKHVTGTGGKAPKPDGYRIGTA